MMIRLFDIENGQVVPTEHCYTLAFLRDIINSYPGNFLQVFSYLFYMTCPNPDINPFFNVPDVEKEDLILQEIQADFSPEDDLIVAALEKLRKLFETRTYRLYRSFGVMLDRLGKYMESTPIEHGRDGNISALVQAAKNIDAIRQSFKGVERDHLEEMKTQVRGGQQLAYDQ